ncbi:MAG: Protein of unknown function rane [Frankiales bacterium]|nr:Protein of unknown function rane [Frankiales bacterium]
MSTDHRAAADTRRRAAVLSARGDDAGTIIPLVLMFALIASLLLLVVIDATVLFLTKRSIGVAADGAALAAAQSIDKETLYTTGGIVGNRDLPLTADSAARDYLAADNDFDRYEGLTYGVVVDEATNQVTVTVTAPHVHIPFVSLFPEYADGIEISNTATAVLRCGDGAARTCG